MSCRRCPEKVDDNDILQQINAQLALETDLVSDQIATSRLAVCESCEHLINRHTCGLCGCYIHFRAKLAFKNCPEDRGWEMS